MPNFKKPPRSRAKRNPFGTRPGGVVKPESRPQAMRFRRGYLYGNHFFSVHLVRPRSLGSERSRSGQPR